MNIANKLTTARVILVFVFMAVIWIPFTDLVTRLWLALAIFIIASLTDFLDGYLARKLNLVTNLGKFMDPLADKMLVAAAMIAIVDLRSVLPAGNLPAWIVVIILLREFMVSGIRLVAATDNKVIAANYLGKVKTVIQMVMISVYLIPIENGFLSGFALVLAYAALLLTLISGFEYLWQNREILKNQ
ncbi:CDP-diacylglycerol--glycerol-3-phosphate 3-phosphatidyltransferase [Sporanaerobium hydrogeniformans]|uniref:CDP-diacylglycerol--glycerol-3-phosphate 3-phosphatidyltransferase n=1 Tax=Sporanaerobium hydrogeniformans TaxID=3072179 RepID=A0AC61DD25_9FIRM|nr:CDP-diacylglycerol--glycerol-3-phosphate 3-phosphatidyltransferase [Sporanaerobium hydrogeniformans]PHV70648.1 CDP-diacylglycerol--glycerol-3-phosphate 3-phosphatidyltransferase [Sporanaerobium hydrogeniformans]